MKTKVNYVEAAKRLHENMKSLPVHPVTGRSMARQVELAEASGLDRSVVAHVRKIGHIRIYFTVYLDTLEFIESMALIRSSDGRPAKLQPVKAR